MGNRRRNLPTRRVLLSSPGPSPEAARPSASSLGGAGGTGKTPIKKMARASAPAKNRRVGQGAEGEAEAGASASFSFSFSDKTCFKFSFFSSPTHQTNTTHATQQALHHRICLLACLLSARTCTYPPLCTSPDFGLWSLAVLALARRGPRLRHGHHLSSPLLCYWPISPPS